MNLLDDYIAFINELDIVEITAQEQGIEWYNLLRKAMYIVKEKDEIEEQIEKMNEVANTQLDYYLNHYGFWFALIALVFSASGPFIDQYSISEIFSGKQGLILTNFIFTKIIIFIVAILIIGAIVPLKKIRHKK
ncbi:hypothetical protein P261_00103 [Lachnospiraceae bacterium TWA4]|nr:hypothetical protein P261_00103 [Lachnospiraceae bacterium TWA4]